LALELVDEVVNFLCRDGKPHGLAEIADSTGISKAKSEEIVQVLSECGFAVTRNGRVRIVGWLVPLQA